MFNVIDSFNGDQRSSYNQNVILRVTGLDVKGIATSRMQYFIVIEGADGKFLWYSKFSYNQEVVVKVSLHEDRFDLTLTDFMKILSNISTIRFCIKTEGPQTDNISIRFGAYFTLESAKQDTANPYDTSSIKSCNCHLPYSGQFCELCAEGYYRKVGAGPFDPCIPLQSLSLKDSCQAFFQGNNPMVSCIVSLNFSINE